MINNVKSIQNQAMYSLVVDKKIIAILIIIITTWFDDYLVHLVS